MSTTESAETLKTWAREEFDPENITRFCDVVMKGGVTSGVVYPLAICYLASKFILKNIGGTSVGAIGAALTAAAEYQRRTGSETDKGKGYVSLARLPSFLTKPGTLQALFTADPGAKSFLNVALTFTGSRNGAMKLFLALTQYWWQTLIVAVALYWLLYGILRAVAGYPDPALFFRLHLGAGLLMLLALLPVTALVYFVTCNSKLVHNDFGWGHGYHSSDDEKLEKIADATNLKKSQTPRLIGWLDAFIQQAAGRDRLTQTLTFGDLWDAPVPSWYEPRRRENDHSIDFRLVTTCLTLGRPFELPFDPTETIGLSPDTTTDDGEFDEARPDLYFTESDMSNLFPPHIVRHLVNHGKPHSINSTYIQFPAARAVPLVVAARLSMSFPVLFCAVRLYATGAHGKMHPVWFSDGGLTSNFPIHFFDTPLPRWPTFAIDLLGTDSTRHYDPDQSDVFLESNASPGTVNPWNRLGKSRGKLATFLMGIIDTARTWLDETAITLPGNSTRTVGIRLQPKEGGINLAMAPDVINDLLFRGQLAGKLLIDLFASAPDTDAWRTQRWMRYRGAMGALTRWLQGFEEGVARLPQSRQATYDSLIEQRYGREQNNDARRTELIRSAQAATAAVASLESRWGAEPDCDPDFTHHQEPLPFPVFAQRRPL
jgi:predicted acylesterase/phospholipase RssA